MESKFRQDVFFYNRGVAYFLMKHIKENDVESLIKKLAEAENSLSDVLNKPTAEFFNEMIKIGREI